MVKLPYSIGIMITLLYTEKHRHTYFYLYVEFLTKVFGPNKDKISRIFRRMTCVSDRSNLVLL